MYTEKEKRKIVPRNGLYPPKEYQSAHLYIVDDVDPDAVPARNRKRHRLDAHTHKCNTIREFFQEYTNCEVHSVRFPKGTKGNGFLEFWREELATKTTDDLVVIYFHGSAGGEEKNYKWTLTQYPRTQINAYSFIKMVTLSKPDSYFILDCFIHTRISKEWKRKMGNTEISARPENMRYPDGRYHADHDGEFTESLVYNLEEFVRNIDDDFKGHKKMKSIPDILRSDETMFSNPLRIWLNRTQFGDHKQIKRFRVDPIRIRRDRKIEFLTVIIQGPPESEIAEMLRIREERRIAAGGDVEGSVFDDEGFGEGDDDEDNDDEDDDEDDNASGGGNGGTEVEVDESNNENTNTDEQGDGLFVED